MKKVLNVLTVTVSIFIILQASTFAQIKTPLEKAEYQKLTSNTDLHEFLAEAAKHNSKMNIEIIGKTTEDRDIPLAIISDGEFGKNPHKIKVLIFAQQHGNEHSGKEGALLLIKEFADGKLDYLLDKIDFLIVPQVNPDGSEADKRRNGKDLDLNRDHLLLAATETQALHKLFLKYLPEVTLDVHEYYPYSQEWKKFGAIKNIDEQLGCLTNPNVAESIRNYSRKVFLPYIKNYLSANGYSFQEYIVGGPPGVERIRYSTFDINDGRQSFGSLNTLSLIMEGKNGAYSLDNIKHRSEGQFSGMKGLLQFVFDNCEEIKKMVNEERMDLIQPEPGDRVAIQMEHVENGNDLKLNLLSQYSGSDTVVTVSNYHPVVKCLYAVDRPAGYLIPKRLMDIVEWAERHKIQTSEINDSDKLTISEYFITGIDSIDFEGYMVINPSVEERCIKTPVNLSDYIFIPTRQLLKNIIVQALEPKSMIGLPTYNDFKYLVKENEVYPILRVK